MTSAKQPRPVRQRRASLPQPVWDQTTRELRFQGIVLTRFLRAAPQQELILTAFQELRWRLTIPNPLSPVRGRDLKTLLNDVLGNLNRSIEGQVLHFSNEDGGGTIAWRIRASTDSNRRSGIDKRKRRRVTSRK
jgi:hypothetical protein